MNEHRLEVADVFRRYEKDFFAKWGHVVRPHQRKAFDAIRDCRTAALGGHVDQCDECGHLVLDVMSDHRSSPAACFKCLFQLRSPFTETDQVQHPEKRRLCNNLK